MRTGGMDKPRSRAAGNRTEWTGGAGGKAGDGRETDPHSKTAGHSGYNGRGTGDGRAPQPSCGEQDGREGAERRTGNGT